MDEKLKILLCEDDENLGMLLREYLQAKGFTTELCADGELGYKAFLKTKFDICVLGRFHAGEGNPQFQSGYSYHLPDRQDTEGGYPRRL